VAYASRAPKLQLAREVLPIEVARRLKTSNGSPAAMTSFPEPPTAATGDAGRSGGPRCFPIEVLPMPAARLSFLALAFTLLLAAPAAAQRPERLSPDLVKALR
jgi:hypothetical protein